MPSEAYAAARCNGVFPRVRTSRKKREAGTIQLDSRLICLVFGRCASLFGAYVFGFNMRAPHALHTGQIHCAAEDTTN